MSTSPAAPRDERLAGFATLHVAFPVRGVRSTASVLGSERAGIPCFAVHAPPSGFHGSVSIPTEHDAATLESTEHAVVSGALQTLKNGENVVP
jgi:hypothetical protein